MKKGVKFTDEKKEAEDLKKPKDNSSNNANQTQDT